MYYRLYNSAHDNFGLVQDNVAIENDIDNVDCKNQIIVENLRIVAQNDGI